MADCDRSLPAERRIRHNAAVQAIFDEGEFFPGRWIHLVRGDRDDGPSRLAVVCSTKTASKAVDRNRIKRLMRETFRIHLPEVEEGWPLVLLATRRAHAGLKRQDLDKCFVKLAGQAGLLVEADRQEGAPPA